MNDERNWVYASYKVYDAALEIKVPKDIPSNYQLNLLLLLKISFSLLKTFYKLYCLLRLRVHKNAISILFLDAYGDHFSKPPEKLNLKLQKRASIFDQKTLFRSSKFSIKLFLKTFIENYFTALKVLKIQHGAIKNAIITDINNTLPNSIFYQYFFSDLLNKNKNLKIFSTSALLFPLTIAGNMGIDIEVKMHGLMGKIYKRAFLRLIV